MIVAMLDDGFIGATRRRAAEHFATFPAFGNALIDKGIAAEQLPDGTYRRKRGRPFTTTAYVINDAGELVPNPRLTKRPRAVSSPE